MDAYIYIPLIITIISELLIILCFKTKDYKIYIVTFLMNIVTNLSLNLIISSVGYNSYYYILYLLEVLIIIIEALGYYLITKDLKKALILSVICNVVSFLIGNIIVY